MKIFKKFIKLTLERKLLLFFICLCILLPFAMARTPLELLSRSLPLWASYGWATTWICDGKPVWEVSSAVYGIITVEMLAIYFGFSLGRTLIAEVGKILKRNLKRGLKIPFSENTLLLVERKTGWKTASSFAEKENKKICERLSKGSIVIIFILLLAPLPLTDVVAVTALGTKKIKYGHWYLAIANIPHVVLLVLFGKTIIDWINSIF